MSRSKSKKGIRSKPPERDAPPPPDTSAGGLPGPPEPSRWQRLDEHAPSAVVADEPLLARAIGLFGLAATTLGSVAVMLVVITGRQNIWVGPDLGAAVMIFGLAGMLYHAVRDADLQFRRCYALLGFGLLAAAILISLVPVREVAAPGAPPGAAITGRLFLPAGLPTAAVGFLFLLAFMRNEDDPAWRDRTNTVFGGVGALTAAGGLIGGNVSESFLLPQGLILALVGLAFLWAFVVSRGAETVIGARAGTALWAAGALTILVALGRTAIPALAYHWHWSAVRPTPYLVPAGLSLMGVGLLYLLAGAGLVSERPLAILARRELMAYFYSPIAYIVLLAFAVFSWVWYYLFIGWLQGQAAEGKAVMEPMIARYLAHLLPVIPLVILGIPVVTMRLLSEERSTGTYEMLVTAPVNEVTVVLGKFIGALLFYLFLWLPMLLYLVAPRVASGPFEYRPLFAFVITAAAVGAGFLSIGLFFSSVTRSQIVAAVLTAITALLMTALGFAKYYPVPLSDDSALARVINHVSYLEVWANTLGQGVFAPRYLIFHLSVAVFFLFATVKTLEIRKWN